MNDPALPHLVMLDIRVTRGSPEARQVVVRQREDTYPLGAPVTAVSFRKVNVAACTRLALEAAARPRTDRGDGLGFTVEGAEGIWNAPVTRARTSARNRLDVVAEAYLAAKAEGRSVRRAVMDAANVQSSQAARLIRAARDAGKLDEPAPIAQGSGPADIPKWEPGESIFIDSSRGLPGQPEAEEA